MDRYTYYSGEVLPLQGLLQAQQSTMVALATQAQMAIGTGTLVDGFTCTPTIPASLNVLLTAGSIYQQENLEATNWSGLNSDTAHSIMKQGILLDPVTLGITPPVTTGYSQVYLIEVQYADSDTGSTVLPYYNASNPASPYSGPGNAGTAQNTMRKGIVAVQVKAGTAAPTGTQVAPTADAGWTGLFTVTVANGASTITSGNIAQLASAPFIAVGGKLPQIPSSIQSSAWTAFNDTGTADALVIAPTPVPTAWASGMFFIIKKGAAANATTTPTLNLIGQGGTGIGTKTIVDRRGAALTIGDLSANSDGMYLYDGTSVRYLGIVSADLAAIGTLRNVKQFSTSTRVSMSGTSGNSYTVSPWSPGAYVKQSATSTLLVWSTFPTFTPSTTGSAQGTLAIGGTNLVFVPTNNTSSLSYGEGTLVQAISGLTSGSYSLALSFARTDSTAWGGVFCFNGGTDGGGYPASTTATIVMAEVGL